MPNHTTHELITLLLIVILAAAAHYMVGPDLCWWFSGAVVVSAVWLSPDLDHHVGCAAAKRWFVLRCLWRPYAMAIPHGSLLSHGPVVGTVGRVLYLVVLLSPVIAAVLLSGWVEPEHARSWVVAHWQECAAVAAGLEAGAALHYTLDWVV